MPLDELAGWERQTLECEGIRHPYYRRGSGRAVILMHEIFGITAAVEAFGRALTDAGFSVYMPRLFGDLRPTPSMLTTARCFAQVCISREFELFARGKRSRITPWLCKLAQLAHAACGGPGVSAIGMCLTGGYALAMAVDPHVLAPVMSQPSLPLPLGPWARETRADLGMHPDDLATVKRRAESGLPVLGLRFTCDGISPGERFGTLRGLLGERFMAIELPSWPGNEWHIDPKAHSVLTREYVADPAHPTFDARVRVIAFLRQQLGTPDEAR